jgi:hypothetical protein
MRIRISELTFKRIVAALQRRYLHIPNLITWSFSKKSQVFKNKLESFRKLHENQRCFILANGPSLKNVNLGLLKDEITFGMNRIYINEEKMGYLPTYLVVSNNLVLSQFKEDFEHVQTTKFFNWESNKLFESDENLFFFRNYLSFNDNFSLDVVNGMYGGGTVTFTVMQLAVFMGFKEIYLLGLDHSFVEKGIPNSTEVRKDHYDESHFSPDYFPQGIKWQLPDLYRSEIAYQLAKDYMDNNDIKIYDLTENGRCTVFDKRNLFSIVGHETNNL